MKSKPNVTLVRKGLNMIIEIPDVNIGEITHHLKNVLDILWKYREEDVDSIDGCLFEYLTVKDIIDKLESK